MDEQVSYPSKRPIARAWYTFLNISLVVAMIVAASLIGLGGAAVFIYRQMGNGVAVSKPAPAKEHVAADQDDDARPRLTPVQPDDSTARHSAAPTVAESTEWHFAEFSDQPRYIDVTYDGGKQHARLKVNTVLSSKPDVQAVDAPAALSSSVVSDSSPNDENDNGPTLSDPGSHYIIDKNTGRVVGIDGTAGAAMEVRRAQPVAPPASPTIRNPVPEVRVASPVMQYGRPLFEGDRPVQAAIPASNYVPTRRALPVNPGDADDNPPAFNAAAELADDGTPVQRATPVTPPATRKRAYEWSDSTSVFRRN